MKKFYFLALFVLSVCIGASAQSDGDYYLDIKQDNTRYYFTWDAQKNLYTITIPELHGDFKIYDSEYVEGAGDQNQHVFGAADGQSAGIKPGEIKTCANPGNNFSVEGGGILYNVVMEFSPTDMTLNIVSGSSTKPEPTTPTITIAATGTATTPEAGTVDYTITAYAIDSPESLTYDITLAYIPAGNSDTSNVSTTLTGTLSGSQTLSDLTIGSTTTVTVTATATAGRRHTARSIRHYRNNNTRNTNPDRAACRRLLATQRRSQRFYGRNTRRILLSADACGRR